MLRFVNYLFAAVRKQMVTHYVHLFALAGVYAAYAVLVIGLAVSRAP